MIDRCILQSETNERTGFIATQVYVVAQDIPNHGSLSCTTRRVDSVWQTRKHAEEYIEKQQMKRGGQMEYVIFPVSSYQWAGE